MPDSGRSILWKGTPHEFLLSYEKDDSRRQFGQWNKYETMLSWQRAPTLTSLPLKKGTRYHV